MQPSKSSQNKIVEFKVLDTSLKFALFCGVLLLLIVVNTQENLLSFFIILGVFICIGLLLPRYFGRSIRRARAKRAKDAESSKWGFHSRDREGPWISYIDFPLVRECSITLGKTFYSEWLVIENGKIIINPGASSFDESTGQVNYDLDRPKTYAWDGCTPKRFFFWLMIIGTPDWYQIEHDVTCIKPNGALSTRRVFWQLAMYASLVHDALYQYLDTIPMTKHEVDVLFYDMLIEQGMHPLVAKIYYLFVRHFGASDVDDDQQNPPTSYTCETFKHL